MTSRVHMWQKAMWLVLALPLSLCANQSACDAQDARFIVRFKSAGAISQRDVQILNQSAADLEEIALQDIDRIPHDNAIVVRLRVEDAARVLDKSSVETVELDAPVVALREVNDPLLAEQYSLQGAASGQVADAWDISIGYRKAMVAVIDTGVDLRHPDLRANLWRNSKEIPGNKRDDDGSGCVDDIYGCDIMNKDGSPQDDNGHGTHVAGIVAAVGDNQTGVVGVAWGTKVIAVKALDSDGNGFVSTIIKGINYVTDLKKRGVPISVINLSLGGGSYSDAMLRAVERARNHDILTVAAAGNEGTDNDILPLYPASFAVDSVVSVAATNREGNLASFSNYGSSSVHIAAPGSAILSTARQKSGVSYRTLSGTSMACPHVAGVLALIAAANPQLSMLQARAVLLNSGASLPALQGFVQNGAFVDALAAVQRAQVTQGLPRVYGYVRRGSRGIQGAQVTVRSRTDPAVVRVVQTAKDGSYSVSELPLGDYTIRASKKGQRFKSVIARLRTPKSVRKSLSSS